MVYDLQLFAHRCHYAGAQGATNDRLLSQPAASEDAKREERPSTGASKDVKIKKEGFSASVGECLELHEASVPGQDPEEHGGAQGGDQEAVVHRPPCPLLQDSCPQHNKQTAGLQAVIAANGSNTKY